MTRASSPRGVIPRLFEGLGGAMVRGVGNALHAESAAIPNVPLAPRGIKAGDAVMPSVDHAWLRTFRRAEPDRLRSPAADKVNRA